MRIGIFTGSPSLEHIRATARQAEADGFDSFWLPQVFDVDALGALTLIGAEVPRIELGTAVVPTFTRHPMALASAALTASAASGGRLTLGIGLSHQMVVEHMWGYSFDKPVRHMREYLEALGPLLAQEDAHVDGEAWTAHGGVRVTEAGAVPVLVAALGEKMLGLAARLASGTVTWMTGPATLADHTVPTLQAAAAAAGTGDMRVVSALPVAVTDDPDAARARCATIFEVYGMLPSYRAMLDREGVAGPADVALIGSAAEVEAGIGRMRDAGVTDFVAVEFCTDEPEATATRELLKGLL